MFVKEAHYLKDSMGKTYVFTRRTRLDGSGNPRWTDVIPCRAYARQTLHSILESGNDPFHYRLLDLWHDTYERPWAPPRTLNQLVEDLATKIASGELKAYVEDNPLWHMKLPYVPRAGGGDAAEESADAEEARIQNTAAAGTAPATEEAALPSTEPVNSSASGDGAVAQETSSGAPDNARSTTEPATTGSGKNAPNNASTCTGGEPISLITGEELLELTDFVLPGPLPLAWTRTYRNSNARDGGLGHGWTSFLTETLTFNEDQVQYWNHEGRNIPFPIPAPGQYSENLTESLTLTRPDEEQVRITDKDGTGKSFRWIRGAWRPASVDDRFGNQWHFSYPGYVAGTSASTKPILPEVLESSWGTSVQVLSEQGRVVAVTSSDSEENASPFRWVDYRHDAEGDLVKVTDPEGHAETYAYSNHVITRRTLKTGFSFYFQWDRHDSEARCIRQWGDRDIYDYHFEWDPDNRHTRYTDSNGGVSELTYNDKGLPVREVDPEGGVTLKEYDDTGLLVRQTDPNGRVTQYRHDSRRRLTQVIDAEGNTHRIDYNDRDQPVAITDPAANTWQREYNDAGAPTAMVDPAGNRHETIYNAMGLPSLIRDPLGHERRLLWSQKGELVGERLPNGLAIKYQYDTLGRITAKQVGKQSPTRYQYNRNGQVTKVVQPDGKSIQVTYNEAGFPTSIRDASGAVTRYEYDGLSQVRRKIDPQGQVFTYDYDRERNLIGLINEKGERYQLAYDKNERLIEEVGFDGRLQRYHYDPVGNLTEQVELWRQGNQELALRTGFQRDAAGRLVQRTDADNATTAYRYDANGRLREAANADAEVAFRYDALGRMVEERQNGQRISYRYDAVGNPTKTVLPDGQTLYYEHDELGGYRSVQWNQHNLLNVERDELGREVGRQQGNLHSQFDYDPAGRLTRHRVVNNQSKATLIQRQYDYNERGNLALIDDLGKGVTRFQYDALERLSQVEGFANESFDFDPAGNLLAYQANNKPEQKGQAQGNRLTLLGDRKFDYDARGNLIRERRGKGGKLETHYHYNAANQLTAVEKDGQRYEYKYDPFGRRIAKITPDGATHFLWNGDVLAWEAQGEAKTYYVYEPNSFLPLAQIRNDRIYHYHLDHLGTPQELTDANGNLAWSVRYRAYGNVAYKEVETVENNLRFQGQYYDAETGLHYNRHRYYDPAAGRFISQDPIGLLGGDNNYQYVPNPTGWVDPFGLQCKEGKVRIHQYESDESNPYGHFSAEVIGENETLHTHQVITASDKSATTIVDYSEFPASKSLKNSVEVTVPDADSAIRYQKDMMWSDLGPYSQKSNSCVDHVANVLRASGENVKPGGLRQYKYLKDLGFF